MNIVVINGTEVKGCTYNIKESFLDVLRDNNKIKEFYLPKDCPNFCTGCKCCFLKGERFCPSAKYIQPIWDAILEADLLVFAYPVYALRTTGQMKVLLDHLCCHWIVHRPDKEMFNKRAVIITQAIGVFNRSAQKDVETSLNWLGISNIKSLGFGMLEGVNWNQISEARKSKIINKTVKFAQKFCKPQKAHMGLKVKIYFTAGKFLHKLTLKNEKEPSVDNQHWIDNGWIKR